MASGASGGGETEGSRLSGKCRSAALDGAVWGHWGHFFSLALEDRWFLLLTQGPFIWLSY